jgi:FKBP-type peptidyl-prolyl cis-trans isomerase 2
MTEDEMAYSMKIEQYWVIKFEYVLRIEEETVDRSLEGRPLTILTHFAPDLPAGLEAALIGKRPGEYTVSVPPDTAYGPYDPAKRVVVQRRELPEEPRPGGPSRLWARMDSPCCTGWSRLKTTL